MFNQTRYQFPRSLGLEKITPIQGDHIRLHLGFTAQTQKLIKTDEDGLRLLKYLFKPKTINEIAKKFNITKNHTKKICKNLAKQGVLNVVKEPVPKKYRRYDRHFLFFENNQIKNPLSCQKRISNMQVALIGMGGIGNWVSLNLIGAGLKEIRLVDFDTIEESNLTRQVLFSENDIGKNKTTIAKNVLSLKNHQTIITENVFKITGILDLKKAISGVNFVILSADRPEKIHEWVDAFCIQMKIPYINLGYRDGIGVVGPMTVPGQTSCYQCHKPKSSNEKEKEQKFDDICAEFDSRYQAPSFGPLNAWVSTIGALEVLKFLGNFGSVTTLDTELLLDPLTLRQSKRIYTPDSACWHCH